MAAGDHEAEMAKIHRRIAFYERQTAKAEVVTAFMARPALVLSVVALVAGVVGLVVQPDLHSAAMFVLALYLTASSTLTVVKANRRKREQKSSPAA